MKESKKGLWIGTEDLNRDEDFIKQSNNEFFEVPLANDLADGETAEKMQSNRRDFLKYLGFSIGAAAIAASCDTPVRRAIPYVSKPDAIVPGVANYYASSIIRGGDFCPVLVKTREGRPIKVEGNRLSPFSKGGTSARAQAAVLELYDHSRNQGPARITGDGSREAMSWQELDGAMKETLHPDATIRIVANTIMSPGTWSAIEAFTAAFPNTRVVQYDPVSSSALLKANERSFGVRAVPDYSFDKADFIMNFGADFLGTWISPVEYASRYAARRKLDDGNREMSRHVTVESGMSLTGSNADNRIRIRPSEMDLAIATFYNALVGLSGQGSTLSLRDSFRDPAAAAKVRVAAEDCWKMNASGKHTLVVSGTNTVAGQLIVNEINHMLGNIGDTVDFSNVSYQRRGIDSDIVDLIDEMNRKDVDAVFFMGDANPCYDLPDAEVFATAMANVSLKVSLAVSPNETMAVCDYVCPASHTLESWGDVQPKAGYYALIQPAIRPIFNTRPAETSLLTWSGSDQFDTAAGQPYYEYLKKRWEENIFPLQTKYASFREFWDRSLHDGFATVDPPVAGISYRPMDAAAVQRGLNRVSSAETEVQFYETVQIGSGQYANNPWLQEMPDPLHRVVWDNYLTIPVFWDGKNKIEGWKGLNTDGDLVEAQLGGRSLTLPIVKTFGHKEGVVTIALGYGRTVGGRAGVGVGQDMYPYLSRNADGDVQYFTEISVGEKVGRDKKFGIVQYHHTYGVKNEEGLNIDEQSMMTLGAGYQGALTDRSVIFQANLPELDRAEEELKEFRKKARHLNEQTIYSGHEDLFSAGHKWEMSIDLNSCIGCGACQVACVAENNVPVVGKTEVSRHHEMTWLRIDRYYYGDVDSPHVVYQPMMCQHCDNAPCENVCPVGATSHSREGLNHMTYNRCIGTRYCANNCPYKVRRFNWLDFTTADLFGLNENYPLQNAVEGEELPMYADNLTRMVLNPDVTVRVRGVIEKCSFCVQRIQAGKLAAKEKGRAVRDGEISTACVNACPTGAIKFGDINDDGSEVAKLQNDPRNYYVLEETNVRASVGYRMRVTNRNEEINNAKA